MRHAVTILTLLFLIGGTTLAGPGVVEEGEPKEKVKEVPMSVERLTPRIGESWFAMENDGETVGYARLAATKRDGGGVAYDWELKMAFPGSSYEEERTLVVDAQWRLVSATFGMEGKTLVEGRREGQRVVGTSRPGPDGKPEKLDVEIADDAISGMGFVLAACMPHESGLALIRTEVNVPQGFKKLGTSVLRCRDPETLEVDGTKVEVRAFDSVGHDGKIQKIWVDAAGGIVRTAWGGGVFMHLRPGSTKHLFRPIPAVVTEVPSGPETLVVRGEFPDVTPAVMFDRWTKPAELTRWWPQEAEVEPEVGGKYHLSWPAAQWFLKGVITVFEPAKRLGFTWKWHHEKDDAPARTVLVEFTAREGGGTVMTITHGPYGEGETEIKERAGHLEGWQQFCTKLASLK